jgi:hypothetical protein
MCHSYSWWNQFHYFPFADDQSPANRGQTCLTGLLDRRAEFTGPVYRVVQLSVAVWLLGTSFELRNCISEPGPQEPYRAISIGPPCSFYPENTAIKFACPKFTTACSDTRSTFLNIPVLNAGHDVRLKSAIQKFYVYGGLYMFGNSMAWCGQSMWKVLITVDLIANHIKRENNLLLLCEFSTLVRIIV